MGVLVGDAFFWVWGRGGAEKRVWTDKNGVTCLCIGLGLGQGRVLKEEDDL